MRPSTDEAAEEEERRKEEARARAEAEQAALEQLKEENPEAYAKRERPAEGEEGEEGEARPPPRATSKTSSEAGTGVDGQDLTASAPAAHAQVQDPRIHPLPPLRPRRAPCIRKFGVCRICLRELAHEGFIPGMTKSSW